VIDEVTFRKTEGGHNYAYLHAAPNADPAALQQIFTYCNQQGWQCTPYNLDGKSTLQLQGFNSPNSLVKLLQEMSWTQGATKFTPTQNDKLSFKEQVKKRSLGASGAFYVIGDAAFTKYGYADANKHNIAAGILYGAGTLSLLGGGRKDQSDLQIREISKQMSQYLKDHGAEMPNSCSLDSITRDHKKGLIKSADDLFRRYPSELMNLFYAAAGICIGIAAHKQMGSHVTEESFQQVLKRKRLEGSTLSENVIRTNANKYHKLESKLDIGLGSMTALSGLFAMMVKEKKHDPDAPEKHGLEALWQKIQERPLAVAGIGYMVSTMCHALSTLIARSYADDKRRSSVFYRGVFVVANIIAELLLAISSKGHGEGVKSDKTVDNTVIALAADLIVKQPVRMQEGLINHVATFLGKPEVLAIKDQEVKTLLHSQVEAMRKNPWAMCNPVPDAVPPLPEREGNVAVTLKKSDLPASWTTKVTPPKDSPQPQLST